MIGPIQYLIDHIMLPFLQFSYNTVYPNYAIGIILLTIVIKLALYPLTHKQFVSMKRMQTLQPEFKKIREKYKTDAQKLQQETMKLYKDSGVNPLSGCLPMLVQLPFLFALFYTMTSDTFKTLLVADGVFPGFTTFWLPDLSLPDHLYILPLVIGFATFLSQRVSPMSGDAAQQKLLMLLPVVMVVICFRMPAGVLLYWASSQIITTMQQISIMKSVKEEKK